MANGNTTISLIFAENPIESTSFDSTWCVNVVSVHVYKLDPITLLLFFPEDEKIEWQNIEEFIRMNLHAANWIAGIDVKWVELFAFFRITMNFSFGSNKYSIGNFA